MMQAREVEVCFVDEEYIGGKGEILTQYVRKRWSDKVKLAKW